MEQHEWMKKVREIYEDSERDFNNRMKKIITKQIPAVGDMLDRDNRRVLPMTPNVGDVLPMMPTPVGPRMPDAYPDGWPGNWPGIGVQPWPEQPSPLPRRNRETEDMRSSLSELLKKKSKENMVLKQTSYSFDVNGRILDVDVVRVFKNEHKASIEAIMTIPVPLNAVIYDITYEIDGRKVTSQVKAKSDARDTYEEAVSSGKSSVLHEEIMKGIHMISIGNIPSGKEVTVQIRFALLCQTDDNRVVWRIPVNADQVYGQSPLEASDDFEITDVVQTSAIHFSETAQSLGLYVSDRKDCVSLDHPIDVVCDNVEVLGSDLSGYVRTGKNTIQKTVMRFSELLGGQKLDMAILCDISGSMNALDVNARGVSKYEQMILGLMENHNFRKDDRVDIFAFNNRVFEVKGNSYLEKVSNIPACGGGTNIGSSIEDVARHEYKDILVLTDGKSYSLDVEKLASLGVRISVVLIGEDSLEALIGHVSMMTNGFMSFTTGGCVNILRQMIQSLRTSNVQRQDNDGLSVSCGNQLIHVSFEKEVKQKNHKVDNDFSAIVASLLMRFSNDKEAMKIAEANHIVSHLTSLVLVDDEAQALNTLPKTVKVPLSASRSAMRGGAVQLCASGYTPDVSGARMFGATASSVISNSVMPKATGYVAPQSSAEKIFINNVSSSLTNYMQVIDFKDYASRMDWNYANEWINGDLSHGIPDDIRNVIQSLALNDMDLIKKASESGVLPVVMVIIKISRESDNRLAKRFLRFVESQIKKV